ncbi:MAG: triose-phosphate isomerase [Oscillospiraceae bacterium]|nr:triose-phosphate isomerase [Oscillospiraceae bacterium]
MNRRYRKTIIAGNWKMNKTPKEARALVDAMRPLIAKAKWCTTVLCVPFVDISSAMKATRATKIAIGAQNVHWENSGAYTGEVSAQMLADLGIKYVIIGHSERRQYFGETDEIVNKKVLAALEAGLKVIICVGETLEERERGVTTERIRYQVKSALNGASVENIRHIIIAYEPIWAIGTGKTATPEQANAVCTVIRDTVREIFGARAARSTTIQYGGSMNAENAAALLAQPNIDGGLIGGASLKPESFKAIVDAANQ